MQTTSLTFKVDLEGGTAELLPIDEQVCFLNMYDILILDILSDLISDLHEEYKKQHKKTFDLTKMKCLNDNLP